MDIHREVADKYQGLFNLMSKEHNLILTISEMDEIIIEAQKVVNKNSSNPVLCDSGCDCPISNTDKVHFCDKCTPKMYGC